MHAEDFIKKQQKYTRKACGDMAGRHYKMLGLEAPLRDAHRSCDGGKAQAIL
jgi:hypothetical protein